MKKKYIYNVERLDNVKLDTKNKITQRQIVSNFLKQEHIKQTSRIGHYNTNTLEAKRYQNELRKLNQMKKLGYDSKLIKVQNEIVNKQYRKFTKNVFRKGDKTTSIDKRFRQTKLVSSGSGELTVQSYKDWFLETTLENQAYELDRVITLIEEYNVNARTLSSFFGGANGDWVSRVMFRLNLKGSLSDFKTLLNEIGAVI